MKPVGLRVYTVHMTGLRERILDHASALYLEDGLEGFSMRRLARRVGVTAPALYRHFEGRDALLVAIIGESADRMMTYLARGLTGRSPMDRLARAGAAYMEFALDHPRSFLLWASLCERMDPELQDAAAGERVEAVGQFWEDRVRECIEDGALRPGTPDEVGLSLWAHCYGLLSLHLGGALGMDDDTFRAVYMGSCLRILRGLATPEGLATFDEETPGGEDPS